MYQLMEEIIELSSYLNRNHRANVEIPIHCVAAQIFYDRQTWSDHQDLWTVGVLTLDTQSDTGQLQARLIKNFSFIPGFSIERQAEGDVYLIKYSFVTPRCRNGSLETRAGQHYT